MALIALGACYFDTILTVPYYPGEDEKLRASTISHRRGGNCPNTLEVLGQLVERGLSDEKLSLNLITVLPSRSSEASQLLKKSLGKQVQLDNCIYREQFNEPASSYVIKSQKTGSRTIVNHNELPDMTLEEFKMAVESMRGVANKSWFHFEGRIPTVTIKCIEYIRLHYTGAQITVEVEKPGRPGLQELAETADVVFYSKGWAQHEGYSSAEECLREQSVKVPQASLLFCTWGDAGAAAFERQTCEIIDVPAHNDGNMDIIDTIGAGDTFIAGILYGLIYRSKEWDFQRRLNFANRLAGLKVTQEGFSSLHRALDDYV
ncbi:uncharacterized protein N7511_008248 [Penicillium nucicola]|uniref:uncharacterized protein n=1 Tax=Penicillium nucicola TaxID=1850975 RepID=UPI002544F83D|nr:uncharacterized protein N7511_008248 [Penicillium nucicola]KAJ5754095.1 hypothetical protein N7511_008248 [Penicillium nucicola]